MSNESDAARGYRGGLGAIKRVAEDIERDAHESELVTKERAKELAEEAWVERSGRERGDLDLTDFQERAARSQFNRWWDRNVSNE